LAGAALAGAAAAGFAGGAALGFRIGEAPDGSRMRWLFMTQNTTPPAATATSTRLANDETERARRLDHTLGARSLVEAGSV